MGEAHTCVRHRGDSCLLCTCLLHTSHCLTPCTPCLAMALSMPTIASLLFNHMWQLNEHNLRTLEMESNHGPQSRPAPAPTSKVPLPTDQSGEIAPHTPLHPRGGLTVGIVGGAWWVGHGGWGMVGGRINQTKP